MQLHHHMSAGRKPVLVLIFAIAAAFLLPSPVLAQTATPTTPQPTQAATATPQPTTTAAPALTLSNSRAASGTSITANGSGFRPTETVDVTFNGTTVGSPVVADTGAFSLSFTVPQSQLGTFGVLATGRNSGLNASANLQVVAGEASISLSVPQAAPGTAISITATGFTAGEMVRLLFNGAQIGTPQADPNGTVTIPFTIPSVSPGTYVAEAHGQTSGLEATASFSVLAPSATPAATAAATATADRCAHGWPNDNCAANGTRRALLWPDWLSR